MRKTTTQRRLDLRQHRSARSSQCCTFAKAWACPKIDLAELYLADLAQLYDSLKQTPSDIQHVLLVGHNPGLSYMTHSLDAQQPPSELPTAGLVSFVITKEWVGLMPGCATTS